jgi:RNA polymerase sigma-70 factor (ECF subfamily)
MVFGIALRVLGDHDAAEDVTQRVFVKLWNSPQAFGGGNFSAWLARVARNRAIDELRSRASRSEVELSYDVPVAADLAEEIARRVDAKRAREALSALPAEQREPIELGFFGGLTHVEIAARTGTALGTTKTRIRTGLRTLRASFAEAVG